MTNEEKELIDKYNAWLSSKLQSYDCYERAQREFGNMTMMEKAFFDKIYNHVVNELNDNKYNSETFENQKDWY